MADPMPAGLASAGTGPAPPRLRLKLIGPMDAWSVTSERVLPRVRKTRALLAILALAAPRPVQRQRLAGLLWSTRDREQARASLRQALHELTLALAPCGDAILHANRDQVWADADALWVDAHEVARAGPGGSAALDLYDAPLLEDLDGLDPAMDAWLAEERRQLRDRARGLGERLLEGAHTPEAQVEAARRLLAIDEAHEAAWRSLMRAHAARGERRQALEAYEACRAALARQLRAQPSAETAALADTIRGSEERAAPGAIPLPVAPPRRSAARGARLGTAPLQTLGSVAEEHLSLGLAEEITTALSRFRWIAVVSSASLARFIGPNTDPLLLRSALDLDFLLTGSVQATGERVRVTLRLLDLHAAGEVVWAQRFDREAANLLTLQDEIAAAVVAQIDPEILLIEAKRAAARPPVDPSAYELVLRAIPAIYRLEHGAFLEAGQLLTQAIAREPDNAAAHAWFAYWHVFLVGQGWAEDQEAALSRAGTHAEKAILLDPSDARAFAIAGHVRSFLHHRLDEAIRLHERALSLNPNLPMAWVFSGVAHAYRGDHAEALQRITRYRRLSPMDPHAFLFDTALMIPHLLLGEHEQVVALGMQVTEMNPGLSAAWKPYLAALGHLGRKAEAAEALLRLLAIEPGFTIRRFLATAPFAREADRQHYAEGLRLAGVPEG
ncbi:BTAD domain-containing putative transcriptional regulator [Elioraea tepidiphila]|uniref:BTAD domain-containing putative transcriptional regulator n=2 Tax=Elioraea tepidiphila TaxID=457934 RepID=UPI001B7FEEFF|nr:BTAD domain-containing putative transcriptional regulator [Elioraea tepidiphila]